MKITYLKSLLMGIVSLIIVLSLFSISIASFQQTSPTTPVPSSRQTQVLWVNGIPTGEQIHEIIYRVNGRKVDYVNVGDKVHVSVIVSVAVSGKYSITLQIDDRDKIPIIYDLSAGTWECGVWIWTEQGPEGTYKAKVWLSQYMAGGWSLLDYAEFAYQVGAPATPTPTPTTPTTPTPPSWEELIQEYWWVIVIVIVLALAIVVALLYQRRREAEQGIVVVRA